MTHKSQQQRDSFFRELKRRNVFRVAIVYIIAGWVVMQIVDVMFPALNLPDWTITLVAVLLIIGFPFALIFAWAFELTPEGLKREHEVDRSESITHITGRKLDFIIIGVLSIALILFALNEFVWKEETPLTATLPKTEKSIAVLPFVNMSDDAANEYFSDGISEELLNVLAKIPELRVIGRSSSFQFKGKNEDLRVIGDKLGVTNILEGSVRKSGNHVRITAQLKAVDGAHLWSETYDRDLDDIFKVQDEIAAAVVNTLRLKLLGQELPQRRGPDNKEAYTLYLQGRYFSQRHTPAAYEKAIDYFQQALALDADFALAWDGLAGVYLNQMMGAIIPQETGLPAVRQALDRALKLDPELATAHYARGFLHMGFDWDWAAADAAYKRALALDPGHAGTLSGAALLSPKFGRWDDAIGLANESILRDPLRTASHHNLGEVLYRAGRSDLAETALRKALELSPQYGRGQYYLSLVLLAQGKLEVALAAVQSESLEVWRLAGLSPIYHALGRKSESDAALNELTDRYADDAAFVIAEAHAYRGEIEPAFEWLERAYVLRDPLTVSINGYTLFKDLKDDPRHQALLEKLNLAD